MEIRLLCYKFTRTGMHAITSAYTNTSCFFPVTERGMWGMDKCKTMDSLLTHLFMATLFGRSGWPSKDKEYQEEMPKSIIGVIKTFSGS